MTYDSTADTLKHAQRVGELMTQPIGELVDRSVCHDRSKTEDPELAVFNEYTPKLRDSTYGSEEYKRYLSEMSHGLSHHYANNRHHPEHFEDGVAGMTLVDLIEMLADLMQHYAVFVFTTRKPKQVARWIEQRSGYGIECTTRIDPLRPWRRGPFWNQRGVLLVTNRKLPAVAYIDDRAIRFETWEQALADLATYEGVKA